MKLIDLIQLVIPDDFLTESFDKKNTMDFCIDHRLNEKELPEQIVRFIQKYSQQLPLSKSDVDSFDKLMSRYYLDGALCDSIWGMLFYISLRIYKQHEEKLKAFCKHLEEQVNTRQATQDISFVEATTEMVTGLLNIHLINKIRKKSVSDLRGDYRFPAFDQEDMKNLINYDAGFAINALMLAKKTPEEYCGIAFNSPFWPEKSAESIATYLQLKAGIKRSTIYYPLNRINKIYPGMRGNHTYIATNGKKVLYVRGVTKYSPTAILSSKIACYVNKKHFSSERLLDNHLVASRKHDNYSISLAADYQTNTIAAYLDDTKTILPGMGIIDEVLNFVNESDRNIENYGLPVQEICMVNHHSPLVKIDFDDCRILEHLDEANYDYNILTGYFSSLNVSHITKHPQYIEEKLLARLKLALLSPELIISFANKAFTEEDNDPKTRAIQELIHRTEVAFNLLLLHESAKIFFTAHRDILNTLCLEVVDYINEHSFHAITNSQLINSFLLRANQLKNRMEHQLQVDLEPIKINGDFSQLFKAEVALNENNIVSEFLLEPIKADDNYMKLFSDRYNIPLKPTTSAAIKAVIALHEQYRATPKYSANMVSIQNYTKDVIATLIMVDTLTVNEAQAKIINDVSSAANKHFIHRHLAVRIACDVLLALSGVGLLVLAARALSGKSFFFSQAKTERQQQFENVINWTSITHGA